MDEEDEKYKYHSIKHPKHLFNKGVNLGSKTIPYYEDEMLYGELNLIYKMEDFSKQEIETPIKKKK